MDRFFLAALVRELQPELLGRRLRGVSGWELGVFFSLSLPPPRDLVFSLSPQAPGFYRGDGTALVSGDRPTPPRLKKILQGAEILSLEASDVDRLVLCRLRHVKPSGRAREVHLTAEWLGTRAALYLSDGTDDRILDLVSLGRPRLRLGEGYQPPVPPASPADIPQTVEAFMERLSLARQQTANERRAIAIASGLTPLLAEELESLARKGIEIGEAFANVSARLSQEPTPMLYRRLDSRFSDAGKQHRLSPIRLTGADELQGETFESFNAAAAVAISEAAGRKRAGRLHQLLARNIRSGEKKSKSLLFKLESQEGSITDPSELRRRGELLLAGLGQARPVRADRVRLPNPFADDEQEVEIPIDPRLSLAANAEKSFRQARKAERSLSELHQRIGRLREEVEYWESSALALEDARESRELEAIDAELSPKLGRPKQGSSRRPGQAGSGGKTKGGRGEGRAGRGRPSRLGPRRFESLEGNVILVGRSGRSNEELSFEIARPADLWFHASGIAGAHVVLRLSPGAAPSDREVEQAAALAAYFSKARKASYVEVLVTERRHLRKIKGAPPGLVKVLESRSLWVAPALLEEISSP